MSIQALSSQPAVQAALLRLPQSGPSAAQLASDRKTLGQIDLNAKPAASGSTPSAADIKKAASQFEAIILRQLLAPSIEPIMSGGLGGSGSSGGGIYGYMLTDVLSTSLAQGGGLGLSRMLEKQLTPSRFEADIKGENTSESSTVKFSP